MKILFLTQVLPYPLDAGPKVRAYYVLRHLAQQHEVTLVSFVRATDTDAAINHLRQFCTAVHTVPMPRSKVLDALFLLKSLPSAQPFSIARDWVPAMATLLTQIANQAGGFDAIHADQLPMAAYVLWARKANAQRKPKIVLDQHNAVYMIPQRTAENTRNPLLRALLQLEARKLARYEVDLCRQFDHVTWVTREDYDAVQQQASPGTPALPNDGVIPICGDPEAELAITRQPTACRVTFLGGLHYPPNAQGVLWFAEKVFPQVLAQCPDAILTAIGKQPPAALQNLGIPAANLTVTGYVDDPTPYLAETAVFVVPLLAGGGMRVKIIDAWRWALPVVSTTIGAEGIQVQDGQNIILADMPAAFAEATVRLLQKPGQATAIGNAGRAWILQHYNWRATYRQWDKIYQ